MIMIDLYFFERNVAISSKFNLEIKLCCLIVLECLCLLKICCNQGIFLNYFLKMKSVLFSDYLSLSKQKKSVNSKFNAFWWNKQLWLCNSNHNSIKFALKFFLHFNSSACVDKESYCSQSMCRCTISDETDIKARRIAQLNGDIRHKRLEQLKWNQSKYDGIESFPYARS